MRTKKGYIGKIIEYDNISDIYTVKDNEDEYWAESESVVKHSPNIIDLIEVGDYVNGKEVIDLWKDESNMENNYKIFLSTDWWENNEIKTIVTKEQMQSIEYRVEY